MTEDRAAGGGPALEACRRDFGPPGLLVRAPGRVNLIGEHTDYNLGFVLPGAVDRAIWLAFRRRPDRRFRFLSLDFAGGFEVELDALAPSAVHWANPLMGVLAEMVRDGRAPGGVDCAFGGDVPIGSGMSSSAALTSGFALGIESLFALGYDRVALADLARRAENNFVGVACGIMDPFASLMGRPGRVLKLDCRDLSFDLVPLERPDLRIVLCDSQVRRTLAASEYNARRAQCEAGVAALSRHHAGIASLRDATPEMLEANREALDAIVFRRCAFVAAENRRVTEACGALAQGDLARLGTLMNASHAGLRDEYEVSCDQLDALAAAAQGVPGVLGSRMMGGGFGGCTISLVEERAMDAFTGALETTFRETLRKPPVFHVCRLTGGAEARPL